MTSPFDKLRHVENSREFWSGRELMGFLDYTHWQNFSQAVDRAIISCKTHGFDPADHFLRTTIATQGRPREDYQLSRYGAYLTAMAGDTRKQSVADAQGYFYRLVRLVETGGNTQPEPKAAPLPTTNIARFQSQPAPQREPHWFWGPMPRMSKPQEKPDERLIMDASIALGHAISHLSRVAMQTRDMDLADRTEGIARWLWQIDTYFIHKTPLF